MKKITLLVMGLMLVLVGICSAQVTITEYPVPPPNSGSGPALITPGSDSNVWFTEHWPTKIGRITSEGSVAEFQVPGEYVFGIATGPDGNLWFTVENTNLIGKITTAGLITEYALPRTYSDPSQITAGPDGNMWFTEQMRSTIGRITTTGELTEFPIPSGGSPTGIVSGPDGNIWFLESNTNKIGRITTSGEIVEFSVPSDNFQNAGITSGPDGNLWFGEFNANKIGRITPAGVITEYEVPTPDAGPAFITSGPDNNLWFTEFLGNKIGRITTAGVITEFIVPTANSIPFGISPGPDGNIWFTEIAANKIGKINIGTCGSQDNSVCAVKAIWNELAPMEIPRLAFVSSVPVINDKLYVFGGHDGDPGSGRTIEEYDSSTDIWTTKALYPRGEGRTALNRNAVSNGEIYIFGGANVWNNYSTNTVDKYNPSTDTWTLNVATYPVSIQNAATIGLGNSIYCFGGASYNSAAYNLAFRFDPMTNTFTPRRSMNTPREGAFTALKDGKIWVIGGYDRSLAQFILASIDIYDPASDTWTAGPNLPYAGWLEWSGFLPDGSLGSIYNEGSPASPTIYRFCPQSNSWKRITSAPMSQLDGYGVAVIGDRLHIFGGGDPKFTLHQAVSVSPLSPDPACTDAGLTACYPFNGNVMDESGNGNNGIIEGAPIPTTDRFGDASKAYSFDGVHDYVRVPTKAAMWGPRFTVSTWASFAQYAAIHWGSYSTILETWDYQGTGNGVTIWSATSPSEKDICFQMKNNEGEPSICTKIGDPDTYLNSWHHYVETYDGSYFRVYIDGLEVGNQAFNGGNFTAPNSELWIGNGPCSSGLTCSGYSSGKFTGSIDETKIYNRALSQEEIVALYHYNQYNPDATPPRTTATPDPPPNAARWNNTDITVGLSATDNADGSGVKQINLTLSGAQIGSVNANGSSTSAAVTAEGITTLTYFATDNAGNQEIPQTLTVKIDKTPPEVVMLTPVAATYYTGQIVSASYTCSDGGSGIASCNGSSPNGAPIDTALIGPHTFTVESIDAAGNVTSASVTYTVVAGILSTTGPAQTWIGLKNSDDVGTKFDFRIEVLKNGSVVASGELDGATSGSSGFNNALLRQIAAVLPAAVSFNPGETLALRVSVRIAVGVPGHRSGTARLWYGNTSANSGITTAVNGVATTFYMNSGFTLSTTPGTGSMKTADVLVDSAVGGNQFKPFGTWTIGF